MNFGDFKIHIPKFANYKNKEIETLTRTNIPTRRKGEQSIRLVKDSHVTIPQVKINIDTEIDTKNMKVVNKTIKELEDNIKVTSKDIDKLVEIKEQKKKIKQENEQHKTQDNEAVDRETIMNVFQEMHKTEEYKNMENIVHMVANKKSSSNKYKLGHSTYTSMLYLNFQMEWLVKHREKLGKLKINKQTTDEEDMSMSIAYDKRNNYVVGFNAGANIGNSYGNLLDIFTRFVITHGKNTLKTIRKQLAKRDEEIVNRIERNRQIDYEHREKMRTDPEYKEKQKAKQRANLEHDLFFM